MLSNKTTHCCFSQLVVDGGRMLEVAEKSGNKHVVENKRFNDTKQEEISKFLSFSHRLSQHIRERFIIVEIFQEFINSVGRILKTSQDNESGEKYFKHKNIVISLKMFPQFDSNSNSFPSLTQMKKTLQLKIFLPSTQCCLQHSLFSFTLWSHNTNDTEESRS